MNLRSLLQSVPSTFQYILILALVMILLYLCLTLTRVLGQKFGKKYDYNDPEECEKKVPDLFASTAFKRKKTKDAPEDSDHPDSD